jgi:hypothetical protein
MTPSPRFDPGLLVDRDVWLFFLAGGVLLAGSSAGLAWGAPWLSAQASSAGAWVWGLALLGAPVLGLAYALGFGFVAFPFLESEWHVSHGLLSVVVGLAVWLGYGLGLDARLAEPARWMARGVCGGLGASLVFYTGLAKLWLTLPAALGRGRA